ncbi:hypothetical protein COLO4_27813 [Corchorus olitorius]|uniref:Sulfotransferase domain-containing protein n=1 Tax=Corchorus olitorius TaxID=93759 RepID=A0A1R3HP11_9ROSI|nr:hypothetical protein COLO4_27813 [Corchorus olitorius]
METPDPTLPKFLQEEELSEECRELISSLPTGKDIIIPHNLHQYQGFWHASKMLPKIVTCQNQFEARDSDIFLVTLPKSGTTWLKAIVFALVNRTKYDPKSTQHPLLSNNPHEFFPFLEFEPRNPNGVDSSSPSTPRLFATHLPLVSLPESVKKSGCKLVYLCRNPKDNFVSLFHMLIKLRTEEMGSNLLEDAFENFCRGVSSYGPVWDHALGYWKESLENPERVLFLRYEEMKEDAGNQLRKLAEFIGCPISKEEESFNVVGQISELCSFDHLSNLEVNRTGKLLAGYNNSIFFRRGEVGDWKNHLTPQMEEELSEECRELISSLPTEKGLVSGNLYQYEGFWHTSEILQKILPYQNQFEARDSDIYLVTLPKSGTTWLKAMVFALVNRTQYNPNSNQQHPLVSNNPHQLVPFLESEPISNGVDSCPTDPRLIATHLPLVFLPESVKQSGCKIVYLCRNPKDNFVSLWHFTNKLRTEEMGCISLEETFDKFCRGVELFGPFWDHVLGYWKESLEKPDKVLFLKYEEMKENPGNHLRKIAEFIGCPISMEEESFNLVNQILELCSFDHLSNLEVNRAGRLSSGHSKSAFFRRGEVGDWKNHLTPEMAQKVDEIIKQKLGASGLTFY